MSKGASLSVETTHHIRDSCLCLHLQRAARALARRYDDALRPFRITSGQFSLLVALNRPEPPPMGPVAALLAMDRTTLTANLKPLERRGLVKIAVGKNDRRSRVLVLTAAGRKLVTAAQPVWEQNHNALEQMIDNPDRLRADLRALS